MVMRPCHFHASPCPEGLRWLPFTWSSSGEASTRPRRCSSPEGLEETTRFRLQEVGGGGMRVLPGPGHRLAFKNARGRDDDLRGALLLAGAKGKTHQEQNVAARSDGPTVWMGKSCARQMAAGGGGVRAPCLEKEANSVASLWGGQGAKFCKAPSLACPANRSSLSLS